MAVTTPKAAPTRRPAAEALSQTSRPLSPPVSKPGPRLVDGGGRFRRVAAIAIGACAAYQLGLGAYFVGFRPPLLPEDLRFLGRPAGELGAVLPRLERWLDLVFLVLGGQMAALGLLLIGIALRLAQGRVKRAREVLLLGAAGLLSVAVMSAANFALGSDFRWLLVLPVLVWLVGVTSAGLAAVARAPAAGKGA